MFDPQVPFDPAEECFDAPPQSVNLRHGQRGNIEVVGQENKVPVGLLVVIAHLAQERRKVRPRLGQSRLSDLVAAQPGSHVHRLRPLPGKAKVVLGTSHEEGSGTRDQIHAFEIHVAAIHDVEGSRLEYQLVEPEHVVLSGSGDEDAGGNRSPQIDLSVYLDPGLGLSEVCPRKEREREIHSRRVQGINRVVDLQPQVFARVKRPGFAHERLCQIFPKPPVALLVGIGQRRFCHRLGKAQMVKRGRSRIQTLGNIAQSLPPSQLGESHADELLATTKMPDARLGIVAFDQAGKRLPMHEVENLREDVAAGVHGRKGWQSPRRNSNPSHQICHARCSFYESSKTSSVS